MPKIAVIDIGSNSIHMDLFRITPKGPQYEMGKGFYNKLGLYLSKNCIIPKNKIRESVQIIRQLKLYAQLRGAREVLAFGTSILRKAKNQKALVKDVFKKCRLQIDIVSARRESGYLEKIAREKMTLGRERLLLVDIGGGSTELVILNNKKTYFRKSYAYGLSKVKGKFEISDLKDRRKEDQLILFFKRKVEQFLKTSSARRIHTLIGFSSVAKTFGLIKYASIQKPSDFKGKKITLKDLASIQERCVASPESLRISAEKRDIVYIGTFFFESLFHALHVQEMEISPYSIREGYLIEYLERK